jgi:parallel beta-helix repeat protein
VAISAKKEEETPDAAWFGKSSDLVITNCLISKNKGGIGFRNSKAVIKNNEISENKFFGVWPKEHCEGSTITHNQINGNMKGIYFYQVQGVVIENNNIYDNREYNLAVAEAQDFPIDARNNWFDSKNPQRIDESIFDRKDDADVAEIRYIPFLDQPVELEKR